jgi:serine/threonine protein phosphatase 1
MQSGNAILEEDFQVTNPLDNRGNGVPGKFYAVGDVHGCSSALAALLDRIRPDRESDRVIFLGDYVNRGIDSKGVIDQLIAFKKTYPRTVFLKGNHEVMFIDYLEGGDPHLFLQSGGLSTLQSYSMLNKGFGNMNRETARQKMPAEHWHFLCSLLPYWEEQDYIFVHAGFEKGRHPALQRPEWLFWAEKDKFMGQVFGKKHKKIVFGHFVHENAIMMKDKMGIDLGAVFGGKLACLVLPGMEVITVPGVAGELNGTC